MTSECVVRTLSPAGILLKDWLLLRCAEREKLCTTSSVLPAVCIPAAKLLLFHAWVSGQNNSLVTADWSLGADHHIQSADNQRSRASQQNKE